MSIHIEDLTVRFKNGVTAINHANLNIPNGIFGLLGENGAGKTTLMRVLTTVLKPTSGTVTLDGILYSEGNYELREEDSTLAHLILCETMEEALLLLTENQRYVIKRHYLDEVSQREIAKELGVSNQAVSDMIRKAIRRVQKAYGMDKPDGQKGRRA